MKIIKWIEDFVNRSKLYVTRDPISCYNMRMNALYDKIYKEVSKIPKGKVATYGQIAQKVGNKGLARVVGNALHVNPYYGKVPCHRVVNAQGKLSGAFAFGSYDMQRKLLEAEGVEVTNFKVDLKKYQMKLSG